MLTVPSQGGIAHPCRLPNFGGTVIIGCSFPRGYSTLFEGTNPPGTTGLLVQSLPQRKGWLFIPPCLWQTGLDSPRSTGRKALSEGAPWDDTGYSSQSQPSPACLETSPQFLGGKAREGLYLKQGWGINHWLIPRRVVPNQREHHGGQSVTGTVDGGIRSPFAFSGLTPFKQR